MRIDAQPATQQSAKWVLLATILGSSMVFIDGSVVNVALPTIQSELDASASATQWVVESYALLLAALILVGGALGDIFGRRRLFVIGTAAFAATSIWCGLAPNVGNLIAARAAQGIAGALLTPASLSLITASFPDDTARGKAIGTWSGFTAITTAFGPVLGGWLVEQASWRWVFFINVPLAVAVLLISASHMSESRDPDAGRVDWTGAVLITLGLGALVFGLIEAPGNGWSDPVIVAALTSGAVMLIAFVVVESRVRMPMVPLELFRSRTFSGTNLLTLLLYAALGGALYFLPFVLIQVQGYSSTAAGASLLPLVILMFVLSRWSGGLIGTFGAKLPLVVGPTIAAAGFVLFAMSRAEGSYWTTWFPAAVVLGLGMAITVAPLTTAVMGSVDQRRSGVASGVNNAVSRTASLLAIALFGIVVATVFGSQLDNRLDDLDLDPESRAAIEAQAGDLAAAVPPASLDAGMQARVTHAINQSFLSGFRITMLIAAGMAIASAIAAFVLVEGKSIALPDGDKDQ
jgi:EmrB/QacA subfamily drug resistance transporter